MPSSLDKYSVKKNENQDIFKLIAENLSSDKLRERFRSCGSFIRFDATEELERLKVSVAEFCGNRFCVLCSMRKSARDAVALGAMCKWIADKPREYAFVELDLTSPNVGVELLSETIAAYNKAFQRLVYRKAVKAMNYGYVRKLEITYNPERDDYHPHFHCLFAVKQTYFKDRSYIKQPVWLRMWREAMRDATIKRVWVYRVQAEQTHYIAKYATKPADLGQNKDVFDGFYWALRGRQVLTYNGVFAEARKLWKARKLEQYIEPDLATYVWDVFANYSISGRAYHVVKRMVIDGSQ